jgi:hypothetical protein
MSPSVIHDLILNPLFSVLPATMTTDSARAMLLAIGLQESKFKYRRQVRGPAMGFWQFETAGIIGVMTHHASVEYAESLLGMLVIENQDAVIYRAVQYNDLLAAGLARLLLWTLPHALPERGDAQGAWEQYLEAWRPGRPHKETWETNWNEAWGAIDRA